MAPRPKLTADSFLAYIFHPKKNPQPSGLRKTTLTGLKGGRKKTRLNAFNKLTADKQAILTRSGSRDAYLRGETTLTEAKAKLRPEAISKGITKPVKARAPKTTPRKRDLGEGWRVFHHLNNLNTHEKKDPRAVAAFVNLMNDEQRQRALSFTRWDQVLAASTGKRPEQVPRSRRVDIQGILHDENDVVYIDDHAFNVFWYHSGGM